MRETILGTLLILALFASYFLALIFLYRKGPPR